MTPLLLAAGASIPGILLAIELVRRLPFLSTVRELSATARKSLRVTRSSRISDAWKERVLPRYAQTVLSHTLALAGYIVVVLAAYMAVYVLLGWLLAPDMGEWLDQLLRWGLQGLLLLQALVLAWLRARMGGN